MEFKGTKGKWVFIETFGICAIADSRNNLVRISSNQANALLMSKAPEMLEMLQNILEINKHHYFNSHLNDQIQQLIKEATEL